MASPTPMLLPLLSHSFDVGVVEVGSSKWPTCSLMVLVRGEQPARWEPQEEGVMSIAAGFPSVKKPRFNRSWRERTND
jgi:hypothetical protein